MIRWIHLVSLFSLVMASTCGCNRQPLTDLTAEVSVDDRIVIDAQPVSRTRLTSTLDTVGTLLPVRSTIIVAEIDGVIRSIPESLQSVQYDEDGERKSVKLVLDIGTWVNEGDVLIELEPMDYQLKLEQAEAQRNLVEKQLADLVAWRRSEEVAKLQARVVEAEAANELAEAELSRVQRLRESNAISVGQLDTVSAAARRSRAALAQENAELALAEAGPTEEQVAVARALLDAAVVEVRQRQHELSKTTIRAPYSGVIVDRYLDIGDRVTAFPRVEMMRLVDPCVLFAEIDVAERYISDVRMEDEAEVQSSGSSEVTRGSVKQINSFVDPETRTFRVRVGIDNRQGRLRPGGFVRVRLPIRSGSDALVVPRTAVTYSDGEPAVFVYRRDECVEYRRIELGIVTKDACEILGGLSDGELVSVSNPALLTDGLRVRVNEPVLPPNELSQVSHTLGERP